MAVELGAYCLQSEFCVFYGQFGLFFMYLHIYSRFLPFHFHFFLFHVLIGELGDCDPLEHSIALVSEFRFSPKQTEIMEADIYRKWAECR